VIERTGFGDFLIAFSYAWEIEGLVGGLILRRDWKSNGKTASQCRTELKLERRV